MFHPLFIKRITPEAAGSVVITLAVPPDLRDAFDFKPGQFLTFRAVISGQECRRSYSICSPHALLATSQELSVGIKPVEGGLFSNWAATNLQAGDTLDAMPPDGRFHLRDTAAIGAGTHRLCVAAGSGITPLLSIIASALASDAQARFTLVYANQRVSSAMFTEVLQDLKDKYPARLSLVHIFSRQPQEVALFNGRLTEEKVAQLLASVVPAATVDEAFICGPEGMIESAERALKAAGVAHERIHTERFFSADASKSIAKKHHSTLAPRDNGVKTALHVVLDGKTHHLSLAGDEHVLGAALEAGLDLPYSCKAGVCCTCRAKVLEGKVQMDKNFTLEQWEIDKGFVLTCQSRALTPTVVVSYDER